MPVVGQGELCTSTRSTLQITESAREDFPTAAAGPQAPMQHAKCTGASRVPPCLFASALCQKGTVATWNEGGTSWDSRANLVLISPVVTFVCCKQQTQ